MKRRLKQLARGALESLGYEVRRKAQFSQVPECTAEDRAAVEAVAPFTMTSAQNRWATLKAARFVVEAGVPGDIVECGVWRGGVMMLIAAELGRLKAERDLWLFDTFAGMTRPTEHDTHDGDSALPSWEADQRGGHNEWCYASLEDVRRNLAGAGFPGARLHFVQGPCEATLREPKNLPERISLLRLDTDFYESTAAELEVLYPRLSPNGVLIVDDYGHWAGSRKAVDEYFARHKKALLLLPIDEHGARLAIKTA